MTLKTLIARSLRFHWRGHFGVLLGAAVGSAALIGALVVGDSVRLSLRELALQRLGPVEFAVAPPDRFFREALRFELPGAFPGGKVLRSTPRAANPNFSNRPPGNIHASLASAIRLSATASRQDGSARANQVQILSLGPGLDHFLHLPLLTNFAADQVILNDALAAQLQARQNEAIVLRVKKPSALSREAPISPQSDATVALRLRVHSILPAPSLGNFNLSASQLPPLNAFVRADALQSALDLEGRANLLLAGKPWKSPTPVIRPRYIEFVLDVWRRVFSSRARKATATPPNESTTTPEALSALSAAFRESFRLADGELELRPLPERGAIELRSPRIFLDAPAVSAAMNPPELSAGAMPILTYLVNQFRAGENTTPYSMVAAMNAPFLPADMRDDEIVLNQWLAEDLQAGPGAEISLTYFLADSGAHLVEATNRFRVRAVLPMRGPSLDGTLMPEFPGLAKAESTHDWDAGFPLVHKIRDQDDQYWKDHRGAPKAFVTLTAGQRMWGNRFGKLTAIRFPLPPDRDPASFRDALERSLLLNLDPASLGLRFEPVREQALVAASQSQDFGGLFIGFSLFLILTALILMALLFQFGIEQRTNEVGTLLALGFGPARVRNLLLGEGVAIAFVGGAFGVLGGVGYAQVMLYGLATLWRDAVGTSALRFHATPMTLVIGLFASVVVSALTIWIVLRRQARRPARELLAEGGAEACQVQGAKFKAQKSRWLAIGSGVAALGTIGWAMFGGDGASAGLFFCAGGLLLVAELAAVAVLLSALDRSEASRQPTLAAMGLRNGTRRRSRSLASVALLACGSFLVAAIGANRLDAGRDSTKRSSGTGGFALFGEATLPVVRDLNTQTGREFYSLDERAMQGVSVVPFRVRDGDDASCLNLNRAQTPRLLGVKPELLAERKAFTFAKVLRGLSAENPWELLRSADSHVRANRVPEPRGLGGPRSEDDAIPAIGDAASIQWALGKKLGDTIEYTDERGQKFKVRLVAGVANSILQGNLIIDEAEFVKRFPSEAGHRMFLIDVPSNTGAESNRLEKTSAAMSRALQDMGLELTPTTQRLAAFNAVQNTYLNTFQVLGGLGLLLGSAGLGVVVLRNVLERRSELGLLQAVGFRRRSLQWLVLTEHGGLLGLGLAVGITAAVAAVLPALLAPGAENHYVALVATLAGVFVSGLAWTWVATRLALRGELLKALRNE
jgi:ABC-type antimicrobial peptide transport system permease subunit